MSDGKIYGLPAGEQMGTAGIGREMDYSIFSVPQFAMINKVWLDDLGLAMPTTLDELHDVLVAFRDQDANGNGDATDEIPLAGDYQDGWYTNVEMPIMSAFTFYNLDLDPTVLTSPEAFGMYLEDGTVVTPFAKDEFKAGVQYVADMVKDGLIYEGSFTQDLAGLTQIARQTMRVYSGMTDFRQRSIPIMCGEPFLGTVERICREHGTPYEFDRDWWAPMRDRGTDDILVTTLREGDAIDVGDYHFEVIATPGHEPHHLCLFDRESGIFVAGDHVMGDSYPSVILSSDSDELGTYLESLDKIRDVPAKLVLCGHGALRRVSWRVRLEPHGFALRHNSAALPCVRSGDHALVRIRLRLDFACRAGAHEGALCVCNGHRLARGVLSARRGFHRSREGEAI
jgi:glyoxylase-like metal-dependent hydrolase (beta-lactamase superfamily II)